MAEPSDKADLWSGLGCGVVILCAAAGWTMICLLPAIAERIAHG